MAGTRKIMALALGIALALVLLPGAAPFGMTAQAVGVGIQAGVPASFSLGLDGNANPISCIGFGGMDWLAIGYNGVGVNSTAGDNTLTLLLASNQSSTASMFFTNNHYEDSRLLLGMSMAYGNLGPKEQPLVTPRYLAGGSGNLGTGMYNADNIAGGGVSSAYFWPLSVAEANLLSVTARSYHGNWWLRSPGSAIDLAAMVFGNGAISASEGGRVIDSILVRPAFKLNLSSVFFTSDAAATGKAAATVGGGLLAASAPSNSVKITMRDTGLALASATPQSVSGRTITFNYAGATTGKTLSAIITDSTGALKYYGKLASTAAAAGTANITIPDDSAPGDIVKLFVEECNGDKFTDFASDPITLSVTAASAPSGLSAVGCTTVANDNGKITGTTAAMEYSADNGATWADCAASETTGLVPGSYPVRTKAYGTVIASAPVTMIVAANTTGLPTVSIIAPVNNATAIATSGSIVITFSEAIGTTGTVSLDGGTTLLSGGSFDGTNTVYTVPYTNLAWGTTYNITISGFKDVVGNEMAADSTNSFTTVAQTAGGSDSGPAEITVYNANNSVWLSGSGLRQGDLLLTPALAGGDYNALLKLADKNDILGVYDISLRSGMQAPGGAMYLTFALGGEYANQSFTLAHKKADGSLEYFHATADASGNVRFGPLYELSPFMLMKGTLATTSLLLPKTGDSGISLGLALLLSAALLAALAAWPLKKKRAAAQR